MPTTRAVIPTTRAVASTWTVILRQAKPASGSRAHRNDRSFDRLRLPQDDRLVRLMSLAASPMDRTECTGRTGCTGYSCSLSRLRALADRQRQVARLAASDDPQRRLLPDLVRAEEVAQLARIADEFAAECEDDVAEQQPGLFGRPARLDGHHQQPGLLVRRSEPLAQRLRQLDRLAADPDEPAPDPTVRAQRGDRPLDARQWNDDAAAAPAAKLGRRQADGRAARPACHDQRRSREAGVERRVG